MHACMYVFMHAYINDLPDICRDDQKIYLYVDDAKLCNTITSKEDQPCLQHDEGVVGQMVTGT